MNVDKMKEYMRDYRQSNIDKIKEQTKIYRQKNANKINEYNREYRKNNTNKIKDKMKEYMKLYREAHKNEIREYIREYLKNNTNKIKKQRKEYSKTLKGKLVRKVSSHNRRILVKDLSLAIIQQVYEDNIKSFGTLTCYLCNKSIAFGQDSLEHIISLSRGGSNNIDNLEIAHRNCNSSKGKKTLEEYKLWREANANRE